MGGRQLVGMTPAFLNINNHIKIGEKFKQKFKASVKTLR